LYENSFAAGLIALRLGEDFIYDALSPIFHHRFNGFSNSYWAAEQVAFRPTCSAALKKMIYENYHLHIDNSM